MTTKDLALQTGLPKVRGITPVTYFSTLSIPPPQLYIFISVL